MTIRAEIIADSISTAGIRLTTMQLRYPRFIHAEFMTHRAFSRNASSSRAIPVAKLIEDVQRDPAAPIYWGKNQPGMQAREEHSSLVDVPMEDVEFDDGGGHMARAIGYELMSSTDAWLEAKDRAIEMAEAFSKAGYHKQIVNRLLEPFAHINVVVTATEWDNFYHLRSHPDAQPEIQVLSDQMKTVQFCSTPKLLQPGEWHTPYVESYEHLEPDVAKQVSAARCARVSYLTHDGKPPDVARDLELFYSLVGSQPLHASPCEHQATPDEPIIHPRRDWADRELHGNFNGWVQHRKIVERHIK